jgi:hypothetical protein
VHHAGVAELGIRMNSAFNKAAEKSGRGRPIEAMIVVQNTFQHEQEGKTYQLALTGGKMQLLCPSVPKH